MGGNRGVDILLPPCYTRKMMHRFRVGDLVWERPRHNTNIDSKSDYIVILEIQRDIFAEDRYKIYYPFTEWGIIDNADLRDNRSWEYIKVSP